MDKNNRITVLYVHANNRDIGGADYCLFKLAAELDKNVFRPIVCLSEQTEILNLYKNAGIKTYLIDMERIKKSKSPFYLARLLLKFISTIRRIRKIIKQENVDIIHGNDLLDIYGPIAGRLSKIPVTQYVRWIIVSPVWLKRLLTGIVYHINNIVLTVSDGVAREMFSRNGNILPNIFTCYDWIDMDKVGHSAKGTDIRKEFDIGSDDRVVGCVGRLEPWKGQDVFVKAAAEVLKRFPDTKFLVVGGAVEGRGRGNYVDQLRALAKTLNITDRLIFTGHRSDITDVMQSFDIFVHSSISPDPLPGVVMEAMYCAKPVVGADAGGVPEEVANGRTGVLYKAGDHKQMAEKICQLLENPELLKTMGSTGKERVKQVFNKKDLCLKIENIYSNLIRQQTEAHLMDKV